MTDEQPWDDEPLQKPEPKQEPTDEMRFVSLTVDELLTEPPPQRALLTYERRMPKGSKPQVWLPRGVVAILSAPGGTGKSQLCLQLAVAVATGGWWLDLWHASEAGDVCIVAGEDSVNDIRARLYALKLTADEAAEVAKRVHIMPTSGVDARWTDKHGAPTLAFAALRERIAEKAPALVILDPGARFFGPEVEVDNAQATAWIRQAEELQSLASCPTVLVAMHTRKGGGLDQNAVRGSSALVDGARWVAALERVSDQSAPVDLLRIKRVKVNNCPPDDGARTVERKPGGRIGYLDPGSWRQWEDYQTNNKKHEGEATEAEAFDPEEAWNIAQREGTAKAFSEMQDAETRRRKAGRRER